MKLTCPSCGHEIPGEDLNISTDIAYCRACDIAHSVAALRRLSDIDAKDFEKFVLAHVSRDNPDQLRVSPQRWGLLFLLPFTAVWSGFSMGGIYIRPLLAGELLPWPMLLFGIPFLIGSIVLWSIVFYLLVGKVALTVDRGLFTYLVLIGPFTIRRKDLAVSPSSTVSIETSKYQKNNQNTQELRIAGEEKTLAFGAMTLRDDKLDDICLWLQMKLSGLK